VKRSLDFGTGEVGFHRHLGWRDKLAVALSCSGEAIEPQRRGKVTTQAKTVHVFGLFTKSSIAGKAFGLTVVCGCF
jgi:hypothetical protein